MMKHRATIVVLVIVAALVAGACSSSSSDTSGTVTSTANSVEAATVPGDAAATDTTPPDTTQPPPPTTTTASEPVIIGAEPITQITPTSGGGTRPLLEWDPIDGASLYYVTIYTETGGSYWAAVTEETQTYVGGPLQIPAGRTGPNVAEGYTWVVYAEDEEGSFLAASPKRPIAP